MSQFVSLVFRKFILIILSIILLRVDIFVNCGPLSKVGRERGSTVQQRFNSSQFNIRRRDIFTSNGNNHNELRKKALLPELDSRGMPTCLANPDDTFCEFVQNYPNLTKQEIGYSPAEFVEKFGTKLIEGRKLYIDQDLSEERVCRRVPKVIYPQMAKNQANQWIHIVNKVEYIQTVMIEICENKGKPCAYLDRNLSLGMYSICRQKYSYKQLLSQHPTEKRTYLDKFKFPSYCVCYVKSFETILKSLKSKNQVHTFQLT